MHLKPHETDDGFKVWLTDDEVDQLLDAADGPNQRIAFALGARCGLRSEEISLVTPNDVAETDAGPMLVLRANTTKGEKYRETPMPPNLKSTIETAQEYRDESADTPIVTSQSKQHRGVSTRTLRRWMQNTREELAAEADNDRWLHLSFHDLRRTWATALALDNEINPMLVCDWGGWEDLETFLDHYRGVFTPQVQKEERGKVDWL